MGKAGKTTIWRALRFGAGALALAAFAALTLTAEDDTMTMVNGTVTNVGGPFILGATGTNNLLLLTNGARLTNTTAIIGSNSTANGNTVLVTGSNTLWQSSGSNTVGRAGSFNRLVISNGAVAANAQGYVGGTTNAVSNLVVVTGAGSRWDNAGALTIGYANSGNALEIYAGGVVTSASAVIGRGLSGFPSVYATNSRVLVSGAGSYWNAGGGLTFDSFGRTSRLEILDGGRVDVGVSTIGGTRSTAVVGGTGSVWNAGARLDLTPSSSGGQLLVTNGGAVNAGRGGLSGNNNVVWISDPGSQWRITNSLTVAASNGSGGPALAQLVVTNGGGLFTSNAYVGVATPQSFPSTSSRRWSNLVVISGSNSVWSNQATIQMGTNSFLSASTNRLVIENGGKVITDRLVASGAISFSVTDRNEIIMRNGSLVATNASGTGLLNFSAGFVNSLSVSNGILDVDQLFGTPSLASSNRVLIGYHGDLADNTVRIGKSNGTWSVAGLVRAGDLAVGENAVGLLRLTNSVFTANSVRAGGTAPGQGSIHLGGPNTALQSLGLISVGSNGMTFGTGSLLASNGATVEAIGLLGGAVGTGIISNRGGIYQFATNAPVISTGNVFLTAGIVSYRGISNAPVTLADIGQVSNLVRTGPATFMFTGASNTPVERVTFQTNSSSYFSTLVLRSNASLRANAVEIGPGAALLVTNGVSTITGTLTNRGVLGGRGATVTYQGPAVMQEGASLAGSGIEHRFAGGLTVQSNQLLLSADTTFEAQDIRVDGGSLLVAGGALQFTNATPNISSGVILSNGIISYRDMEAASLVREGGVTNIMFQGDTAFRLNNATNAYVDSYIFRRNSTNGYASLRFEGGSNRWQSGELIIGDGGSLFITNTSLNMDLGSRFLLVSNGTVTNYSSSAAYVGFRSGSSNFTTWLTGSNAIYQSAASTAYIGYDGAGNQLIVSNGARHLGGSVSIGVWDGSFSNRVVVTGSGSLWQSSTFYLGYFVAPGNQLEVLHGARLENSGVGYIGDSDGNYALVSGRGSVFTNGGTLNVGSGLATGNTLNVTKGGLVSASSLYITSGGNRLRIEGGNITAGSLTVDGFFGASQLDFQGGSITATSFTANYGTNSQFNFAGGILHTRDSTIDLGQAFTVGDGSRYARLNLLGGTNSYAQGVRLSLNAALTGTGRIRGSVTNAGSLRPGNSAGSLTIEGDLSLEDSASLTFEIGGLLQGTDYDLLTVTNFVQFAGMLSLKLINGFNPSSSDSFTLLNFGSSSGAFNNVFSGARVATADRLGSFQVDYTGTNLTASAYQSADLDGDGIEDAWATMHFGKTPLAATTRPDDKFGDADGDGASNYAEFLAGTQPNDAGSVLRLLSAAPGRDGNVAVRFSCVEGRNYGLAYSDDLRNWTEIAEPEFTYPEPGVAQWVDDGGQTGDLQTASGSAGRFYRVTLK